jgi:outer membrane lipoprotein-sorting protein
VAAMRTAGLLLIAALAACGERTQRAETGVPADSIAQQAPADTAAGAINTDMAITAEIGADSGSGDTPVSNTPAPVQPAGGATPSPRAPAPVTPAVGEPSQGANDAAAILRRASAAYANVRSLRAQFVMHYENAILRQKTTSRGTLYQRAPDRIALRFSDPAGDLLIGDGTNFYWYLPSVDAKQVICTPAAAGGARGVDLQAQFVGNPVERFQATLHADESVGGRTANVLTLVPRQRAEYRSLKVWLDTRDSLARRFEITEQNGTIRRFDLDDMAVNPSIPDATFRFTRPDNARVIGC